MQGPPATHFPMPPRAPVPPFPSALSCACRGGAPPRVLICRPPRCRGCGRARLLSEKIHPNLPPAGPALLSLLSAAEHLPPLRAPCPLHSSLSPPPEISSRCCTSRHAVEPTPPLSLMQFQAQCDEWLTGLPTVAARPLPPSYLIPNISFSMLSPLALPRTLSIRLPTVLAARHRSPLRSHGAGRAMCPNVLLSPRAVLHLIKCCVVATKPSL